jgi:hypothetical protein
MIKSATLQKVLNMISVVTLIVAFFMIGTVFFWMLYPYKPAEIKSVKLLSDSTIAGDVISYELDYCKYMDLPATVIRAFINGIVFTTPSLVTNNPVGCHTNRVSLSIPQELAGGAYRFKTVWIYRVNPLREVSVSFTTEPFYVIPIDR